VEIPFRRARGSSPPQAPPPDDAPPTEKELRIIADIERRRDARRWASDRRKELVRPQVRAAPPRSSFEAMWGAGAMEAFPQTDASTSDSDSDMIDDASTESDESGMFD